MSICIYLNRTLNLYAKSYIYLSFIIIYTVYYIIYIKFIRYTYTLNFSKKQKKNLTQLLQDMEE